MRSLRLSALLHTLLLLVLAVLPLRGGSGDEEGQGNAKQAETFDVSIIEKPAEVEEAPPVEDEGLTAADRVPHAGDKCEKFYGGIGLIDHTIDGVYAIYAGYPAALAGIQVGDEIVSHEEIRGEIGTPVTVVVRRGMRTITFHMIRDKICIE